MLLLGSSWCTPSAEASLGALSTSSPSPRSVKLSPSSTCSFASQTRFFCVFGFHRWRCLFAHLSCFGFCVFPECVCLYECIYVPACVGHGLGSRAQTLPAGLSLNSEVIHSSSDNVLDRHLRHRLIDRILLTNTHRITKMIMHNSDMWLAHRVRSSCSYLW